MQSYHWVKNFTVNDDDIDFLTSLLLEREMPLSTADLAHALITHRLETEAETLREQLANVHLYNPANQYEIGQQLTFPALEFATGIVTDIRQGDNPSHGDFEVISVEFENGTDKTIRQYAASLATPHALSQTNGDTSDSPAEAALLSADDILREHYTEVIDIMDDALLEAPDLVRGAGHWFPKDLLLPVEEGHRLMTDAVLDMEQGGPLSPESILEQIGGLGNAPISLQTFSLNHALNQDDNFDEVGQAGKVLWYLSRFKPEAITKPPAMLKYQEIQHDRSLLTPEMLALEAEIDDELSPAQKPAKVQSPLQITLIYPHRRSGTLPLNAKMQRLFPTARRTNYIWTTLVDGQDGEEFEGWIVRKDRYVYGLTPYYEKHKIPIGAYVTVELGEDDKIIVNYKHYRPRIEWIRLITPAAKGIQITAENHRRNIGAEYDEQMIIGAEDVAGMDALFVAAQKERKTLNSLLRMLIFELGRLTPQGTVHFKTLYSALNAIQRCPPAPIFAALVDEPAFEHVGNHYWKLSNV